VNDISAQQIMLIKNRVENQPMTAASERFRNGDQQLIWRRQRGGTASERRPRNYFFGEPLPATGRVGPRATALPHGPVCKLEPHRVTCYRGNEQFVAAGSTQRRRAACP
jgi:hypothetical protein